MNPISAPDRGLVVVMNTLSAGSGGALTYLSNILPRFERLFRENSDGHQLCVVVRDPAKVSIKSSPQVNVLSPMPGELAGASRLGWEWMYLRRLCASLRANVLFDPSQVSLGVPNLWSVLMLRNMEPFYSHRYPYSLRG